jgi:hypothetical protein
MPQHLLIHLSQGLTLQFQIRPTPLAELWVERMQARGSYPLDHPDRFYGFGSKLEERIRAEIMIQQCITTINQHTPIIEREFDWSQDSLNYLHNIFERYHGLLDQQTSEYWQQAPVAVRQALAELNLAVHRCETVLEGTKPRFVCTWFGMPKTKKLDPAQLAQWGETQIKFGTVYLNYCEIGKTVEDLAHDNDEYIGEDAFRPFGHYSADFHVAFFNHDLSFKEPGMQQYIDQHQDFFLAHDITSVYNAIAQPLRFPVADLQYAGQPQQLIQEIARQQRVLKVTIQ